jgi:polynucleotide 5'-hydroxyl-kinase GRC3/NOL9
VKLVVDKSRTLLVDGPASVNILYGVIEVLAAPIRIGERVLIREEKRVPFEVKGKAEFDLNLGEKAVVKEIDGSSVPASWMKAGDYVLREKSSITIMVMGGVDSGKNSLCLYLANRALKKQRRVAIVDADLGQSDLGPPSTIGSCSLNKPAIDLFDRGAENVCFIGVTSSSGVVSKVVDGIRSIIEKILRRDVDVLIINTDGWIADEEAIRFKVALVKEKAKLSGWDSRTERNGVSLECRHWNSKIGC